jgi:hypothetical protein
MKRLCVCIVPFPEMSALDRYSLGGAFVATALEFEAETTIGCLGSRQQGVDFRYFSRDH